MVRSLAEVDDVVGAVDAGAEAGVVLGAVAGVVLGAVAGVDCTVEGARVVAGTDVAGADDGAEVGEVVGTLTCCEDCGWVESRIGVDVDFEAAVVEEVVFLGTQSN